MLEDTLLEGWGILYSYTIQRYRPPPLFRMDDWEPYALGLVELPEGIRVMGMLSGFDLDNIRIGERVRLVSACLYTEPALGEVMTYKFTPVTTEEDSL
ncbi:MAG: OB-fold domain-containing protein [Haliea sp.]